MADCLVQVEQRHIDAGEQFDSCLCPVALALREKFPKREVTVGDYLMYLDDAEFETPVLVKDFIDAFDYHGKAAAKPFTFGLPLTGDAQ